MLRLQGIVSEVSATKVCQRKIAPVAAARCNYVLMTTKTEHKIAGSSNAIHIPHLPKPPQKKRTMSLVLLLSFMFFLALTIGVVALSINADRLVEGKDYTMVEVTVDHGDTVYGLVHSVNRGRSYHVQRLSYIVLNDDRNTGAFTKNGEGSKILKASSTILVPRSTTMK